MRKKITYYYLFVFTIFFAVFFTCRVDAVFVPKGSEYTDISSLAATLDEIFAGNVGLCSDIHMENSVSTPLNSSTVPPGKTLYISDGSTVYSGSSCCIYANAVYLRLFGEVPYQGDVSRMENAELVVSPCSSVSYKLFSSQNVRTGAVLRTTPNSNGKYTGNYGHSIIILTYDSESITYLEGNGDGKGLIRITTRTWDNFNSALLSSRGYYISFVVQPTEQYYSSLSEDNSDHDYISNFSYKQNYNYNFSDVSSKAWYFSYVSNAYSTGMMKGRSSSLFCPNEYITVAEAITLAARIHSIYNSGSDVPPGWTDYWYSPYLYYAVTNGITTYDWDSFSRPVTREEFASLLSASLPDKELSSSTSSRGQLTDVDKNTAGGSAIYILYNAGVLTGDDDGSFRPYSPLKRSEAAAAVVRAVDKSMRA